MHAFDARPGRGPFEFELGQRIQLSPTESGQTIVGRSAGGFGAVYVLESDSGKRLAVKTPRYDLSLDPGSFQRFVEEVLLWIDLPPHPFVLRARGVLKHQDRPYVEMEYVPPVIGRGSSVAALLATSARSDFKLNPPLIWTLAAHLIEALVHVEEHDRAFIHGDIKPANLLLKLRPESAGRQASDLRSQDLIGMLSDFGMARAAGVAPGPNRRGDVNYLAPELLDASSIGAGSGQIHGAATNSKSADVYAVGCTIFELLFNHPRQRIDPGTCSLMMALGERLDPRLLTSIRSDIDLAFAELVASCLDPDPVRRPPTYADLRTAFLEAAERAGNSVKMATGEPETRRLEEICFGKYLIEQQGLSEEEAHRFLFLMERTGSLQSLGEVSKAAALLDEAEKIVPGLASIEARRGKGLLVLDERGPASAHLERAVRGYESDPELTQADVKGYSSTCAHLAQLLSMPSRREPDTALALAAKALDLEPGNAAIHFSHGLALMSAGRLVAAAQALERARELDPTLDLIATFQRCCDLLREAVGPAEGDPPVPSATGPLSDGEEQTAYGMARSYGAALVAEARLSP
ncbi:MAG TPA: protein kinase [Solirubrobacterales bacterium]